jgi:hypothetical protein
MIGNDGQQSTHRQRVERGVETVGQLVLFAVHGDAKGLKDTGRDVTTAPGRHRDRTFHRLGQFVGRLGLAGEDGLGD